MKASYLRLALPFVVLVAILVLWLFLRPSVLSDVDGVFLPPQSASQPAEPSGPAPGSRPGAAIAPSRPLPPEPAPLPQIESAEVAQTLELLPGRATVSCTLGQHLSTPRAVQVQGGAAPILASTGTLLWLRVDRAEGKFELLDFMEEVGDIAWSGAGEEEPVCTFTPIQHRSLSGTLSDAAGEPVPNHPVKGCSADQWTVTDDDGGFELDVPLGRPCTVAAFFDSDEQAFQLAKVILPADASGPIELAFEGPVYDQAAQDGLAKQLLGILGRRVDAETERMDVGFDAALQSAGTDDQRVFLQGLRTHQAAIIEEQESQLQTLSDGGATARQGMREILINGY